MFRLSVLLLAAKVAGWFARPVKVPGVLFENSIVCLVVFVCCFFAMLFFPFRVWCCFFDASFWCLLFVIGFF